MHRRGEEVEPGVFQYIFEMFFKWPLEHTQQLP